jgi:23S rRNA-/tRNA-specific pseudouridylate synthase
MPAGLAILFEDDACLVVNKPGGLLTQAPLGIDSLEFRVKRMLQDRGAAADEIYLGVPHRLDRPASGVIVFAKTLKAAQKISLQFERRFVKKSYWGLVAGVIEPDEGTWTDRIKKIEGEPRSVVVDESDVAGREAVLHYRVVQEAERPEVGGQGSEVGNQRSDVRGQKSEVGFTLLEIELETGRTHQIRVQCASRGHPLLGDELYGSKIGFGPWRDDERERLIGLHARTLAFRHPITKQDLNFVAPISEVWREFGIREPLDGER